MSAPLDATLVSFVLPVYDESASLPEFHRRLRETLDASGLPFAWQFVYVDDGSDDDSLAILTAIAQTDPRVQVLELSRNFGHQIAVTAGLDHATGDAAVIMDTDLQDPPAVALELIAKWREGFNVVYAQRSSRQDSRFKRVSATVFYRVLRVLAEIDIPRDTGDFRLIDRTVIDALAKFPERSRFLRGMVSYVGFKQARVRFDRDERYGGSTGYPLRAMVRFAGDGILGFSIAPLRLVSLVGWITAGFAALGIAYIAVRRIIHPESVVPGWTLTIIAILGVGGLQIIMLSVLGSYLGRVYREVQARPLYLLAGHINGPAAPAAPGPGSASGFISAPAPGFASGFAGDRAAEFTESGIRAQNVPIPGANS